MNLDAKKMSETVNYYYEYKGNKYKFVEKRQDSETYYESINILKKNVWTKTPEDIELYNKIVNDGTALLEFSDENYTKKITEALAKRTTDILSDFFLKIESEKRSAMGKYTTDETRALLHKAHVLGYILRTVELTFSLKENHYELEPKIAAILKTRKRNVNKIRAVTKELGSSLEWLKMDRKLKPFSIIGWRNTQMQFSWAVEDMFEQAEECGQIDNYGDLDIRESMLVIVYDEAIEGYTTRVAEELVWGR